MDSSWLDEFEMIEMTVDFLLWVIWDFIFKFVEQVVCQVLPKNRGDAWDEDFGLGEIN